MCLDCGRGDHWDQRGEFLSYCRFHGDKGEVGMAGTVIVEEGFRALTTPSGSTGMFLKAGRPHHMATEFGHLPTRREALRYVWWS